MGLRRIPFAAPHPEPLQSAAPDRWANALPRGLVRIKSLPRPDEFALTIPEGTICLVTDDGSPATTALVERLLEKSWKVAVLSFPATLVPGQAALPAGVQRFALEDLNEPRLEATLAAIAGQAGPVGCFIHMDPILTEKPANGLYFAEGNKAIVKHVFLIAKHLKQPLNQAALNGRSAFLSVVRLDGEFGLGQGAGYDPISGGLFGLVKTLNLEWDAVFCRAIDLNPDMDPQQSTTAILAELYDPNRLIPEVGYGAKGRCTLEVETAGQEEVENGNSTKR